VRVRHPLYHHDETGRVARMWIGGPFGAAGPVSCKRHLFTNYSSSCDACNRKDVRVRRPVLAAHTFTGYD
jgi:hypothetical protein